MFFSSRMGCQAHCPSTSRGPQRPAPEPGPTHPLRCLAAAAGPGRRGGPPPTAEAARGAVQHPLVQPVPHHRLRLQRCCAVGPREAPPPSEGVPGLSAFVPTPEFLLVVNTSWIRMAAPGGWCAPKKKNKFLIAPATA